MTSQPEILETKLQQLWDEWLAARDKSISSNNLADGIAASRAYWRFYAAIGPEGKAVVDQGRVVPFRK
jgi:hypothetical protein